LAVAVSGGGAVAPCYAVAEREDEEGGFVGSGRTGESGGVKEERRLGLKG